MSKHKTKSQKIEKSGIITYITAPDGLTHVKLVGLNEFSQHEFNKIETDYCTIIGDTLHIGSKAKYDHVIIHYAKKENQISHE